MIAHKDEIYSRPKRTWFATEREKKLLAAAAKVSISEILVYFFGRDEQVWCSGEKPSY